MARTRIQVVLAVVMVTGCGARPHVKLTAAPARGAPTSQRLGAYERHRPVAFTHVPAHRHDERRLTSVILGNRQHVFHPEDLAVLVDPASATAASGRRGAQARASASRWRNVGWGMVAVGTALILTSLQVTRDQPTSGPLIAPGIALVLGGGGVHVLAHRRKREAVRARNAAFSAYDDDLRRSLGLCVDGLRVVDCGGSAPAPPR